MNCTNLSPAILDPGPQPRAFITSSRHHRSIPEVMSWDLMSTNSVRVPFHERQLPLQVRLPLGLFERRMEC